MPSSEELLNYSELISIYNHGTLEYGKIDAVARHDLRKKFEVNVFSVWSLLAGIMLTIPETIIPKQFHVNISSGYAVKPTSDW